MSVPPESQVEQFLGGALRGSQKRSEKGALGLQE